MVITSTDFLQLLQPLLVLDAEALLFVDDHQAEIAELDVLRKQAVGADGEIDLAFGEIGQRGLQLLRGAEAAEHLDAHRETAGSAA